MGCASSKQVKTAVAANVYRPPPTSIAFFDINTIEEPWLITTTTTTDEQQQEEEEKKERKPTHLPLLLLEKLDSNELTPYSWSEVSKALEELKPSLTQITTTTPTTKQQQQPKQQPTPPPQSKANNTPQNLELAGLRPVKENRFIIQDREQRKNNKTDDTKWRRRDPFEGYPDSQPPGNADGVVLYTTTLRGVRRTFEDCEQARRIVEGNAVDVGIDVDERDVSLHGEFLKEVRELAGEGAAVPRLFIRGKYIGGVEEVLELGESGKLREMMRWVAARGGKEGRRGNCGGCGWARFVPCLECSGSCKVVGEDGKEVVRCGKCNENGLALCPLCHD